LSYGPAFQRLESPKDLGQLVLDRLFIVAAARERSVPPLPH
jgi:hypothetical protein